MKTTQSIISYIPTKPFDVAICKNKDILVASENGLYRIRNKQIINHFKSNTIITSVVVINETIIFANNNKIKQISHDFNHEQTLNISLPYQKSPIQCILPNENHQSILCSYFNHTIRQIDHPNFKNYLFSGIPHSTGGRNGRQALFKFPDGLAICPSGKGVFVVDTSNHCIRRIYNSYVTTYAGTMGCRGHTDTNQLLTSSFYCPTKIQICPNGNILISEYYNHCIRKIDIRTGIVSTLSNYKDFKSLEGFKLLDNGNIIVCDVGHKCIREITHTNIKSKNYFKQIITHFVLKYSHLSPFLTKRLSNIL